MDTLGVILRTITAAACLVYLLGALRGIPEFILAPRIERIGMAALYVSQAAVLTSIVAALIRGQPMNVGVPIVACSALLSAVFVVLWRPRQIPLQRDEREGPSWHST